MEWFSIDIHVLHYNSNECIQIYFQEKYSYVALSHRLVRNFRYLDIYYLLHTKKLSIFNNYRYNDDL